MRKNSPRSFPSVLVLLTAVLALAPGGFGQTCVSLTTMGSVSTQNFDTLANTGTANALTIPGWFLSESGTSARNNGQYAFSTGSDTAGDVYSFGAAASTERALGTLRSGTLVPLLGACFTNNTGGAITSLVISYTGEQWRLGTAARTDQLNFEYSTNATDLITGTWTGVAALNFVSPVTTTVGAKDGNAAANRNALSATIALGIANGATIWIHWTDTDATSSDDGLAVDDFSLTPQGSSSSAPPTATGDASPNPITAGNPVSLSATPTSGTNPNSTSYTLTCNLVAIGGSLSVALPTSYLVPAVTAPATYALPCTVTDDLSRSSGFNIGLTVRAPAPTFHTIYEINGPGTASPLAGLSVTTRGVVTAVRASTGSVRGFYLEATTADRDGDANTSEGLLVFTGGTAAPACATVGNYIQIEGLVSSFVTSAAPVGSLPLTELANQANCQILATSQLGALPTAVTIDAGNPLVVGGSAAQSRKWMGMRVSVPNATVVGASLGFVDEPTALAAERGEFFVTVPGVARPLHGAGILDTRRPSAAAATVPAWNGNPESLRVNVTGLLPAGTPYEVAAGSTVTGLSGVMDYNTSAGQFQLYTSSAGAGTPNPATPTLSAIPVPVALASDLTIGSFNMERFYNDTAEGNGAVTLNTAAYQGRLNKASLAIRNVMRMPDIIGLEEVEGQRSSSGSPVGVIQDIVNKVNADAVAAGQGNPEYDYCIGLTNDPGGITVAIVYKRAKVQVTECLQYGIATQYTVPGGGTADLNDRPPVTIRANVKAAGSDTALPLRLVVNHLRSLNGIDEPGVTNGDRVRTKRLAQAKYLANLINGTSGDQSTNWNAVDNLVVVGDFNAFNVNDGYGDVMNCIAGNPAPADQQYFTAEQLAVNSACGNILSPALTMLTTLNPASLYSYSFSGTIQTLDHVLLNSKAYNRFRQIVYARNDADFPDGPTYRNNFTRPERVTDHDMPVVYLRLPVEVTSRTWLNASAVVLNRVTGRFTSRISVTNTGSSTLNGPVHVFFSNLTPGVTLPDLPVYNGQPYATIDLGAGLAPGATSTTLTISFADPTNARIGYTTTRFDGSY